MGHLMTSMTFHIRFIKIYAAFFFFKLGYKLEDILKTSFNGVEHLS